MVKVGVLGAKGRMGSTIVDLAAREKGFRIASLIDRDNAEELLDVIDGADVLLDVSLPEATTESLRALSKAGVKVPYVIGCTGWKEAQLKTVYAYARRACVVLAPNFSPGVNIFLSLLEAAAPLLQRWGYEAIIHEVHHAKKQDSPSGTAKAMQKRLGKMKHEIRSTRTGDVVGTHEIRFVGPADVLTLSHEALDRSIFARGALTAAKWASLNRKKAGLWSMKDVLNSNKNL